MTDDELYHVHEDEDLLPAEEATLEPAHEPASASAHEPASETIGVPADAEDEDDGGLARYSTAQLRRTRDLLTRMYAIRRATRFYPTDHPSVTEGIEDFQRVAEVYHAESVDVHLSFFEGEILLGQQLLVEESVLFDQLIRDLTSMGVGSLTIMRGATYAEYADLFKLLTADPRDLEHGGGITQVAESLRLPHIDLGTVRAVERSVDGEETDEDPHASYGSAVSLVREIDRLLTLNRHVSSTKVKGVVRSLVDNVLTNRYAMLQLTGLKNYDEYTFYHSANVAILSLSLGSMITQDWRFLSSLGVGALLHDIGKLSVDLDILNKPGALTPEEWANVRQHPVNGAEMVSLLPGVDKSSVVTILEHHMRYDSSGYPQRTPPRRQHLASRIVAIADSYDAMTSRRSYSAARVQDEAMALLAKSAGSALDPVLVRLFIRMMGIYPPRSVVRLSGGQIAIVLNPSETDPLRPVVRVIASSEGDVIEPVDLDLAESPDLSVRGCVDPRLLNIEVDDYL